MYPKKDEPFVRFRGIDGFWTVLRIGTSTGIKNAISEMQKHNLVELEIWDHFGGQVDFTGEYLTVE